MCSWKRVAHECIAGGGGDAREADIRTTVKGRKEGESIFREIRAGKFKTDQLKFEYIKAMNSIMNKSNKRDGGPGPILTHIRGKVLVIVRVPRASLEGGDLAWYMH